MNADVKVGPGIGADGSISTMRAGRTLEGVVTDAHARYHEAVARGVVWSTCNTVAGAAPGTALSTSPPFQLYNPTASGKYLSVLRAQIGYVSGTLGAGSVVFAYYAAQPSAPTGGTALTVSSNLVGSGTTGVARAYNGSTIAGTPTILRPAWTMGAALASSVQFPNSNDIEINGEILVAPGAVLVLQGIAAAGTSPLVIFYLAWEETPI